MNRPTKTVHVRLLRKGAGMKKWVPMLRSGNDMHEVAIGKDDTPENTDCCDLVLDTLLDYEIHPGDKLKVDLVPEAEADRAYVPNIRYMEMLHDGDGRPMVVPGLERPVIVAVDELDTEYIGLPVEPTRAEPHTYVFGAADPSRATALRTGKLSPEKLIAETPDSKRYRTDEREFEAKGLIHIERA